MIKVVCHYYRDARVCIYEKQTWSDQRQGWYTAKVFRTLLDVARAGLDIHSMEVCHDHG